MHEPLLTSSLAINTIFFVLEYAPLATPKASYPSMKSILTSILRYIKTSFFCLYFDRFHCSPLFITGMYFCTHFPKSSLTSRLSKSNTQIASPVGMFWTLTIGTMKILITCQRELLCATSHIGCTSLCHGNFNVHAQGIVQFTSEKLAFLDCNHFIKATMNLYPEASKEPFYCILQILSKFTQLATISQIRLYFLDIYHSFIINHPILSSFPTLTTLFPYLRFKACLDHLMSFSLVYRGTRCGS